MGDLPIKSQPATSDASNYNNTKNAQIRVISQQSVIKEIVANLLATNIRQFSLACKKIQYNVEKPHFSTPHTTS
jgi:hypothetical protein